MYRISYTEKLVPKIYVKRGTKVSAMEYPYYVREQNDRRDFLLADTSMISGVVALFPERKSSIQFKGSGLFHFKIEAAFTNISFCSLSTEFIVYVVNAPLAQPIEDIIRVTTAIFFGFVVLSIFLYKYYY